MSYSNCRSTFKPFFVPADIQHNQCVRADSSILNPFSTAVPSWGQTTQIPSGLSPKRDYCSKWVRDTTSRHNYEYDRDISLLPLCTSILEPILLNISIRKFLIFRDRVVCIKQSRQCNAVASYWIRQPRCTHSVKARKIERSREKKQIERIDVLSEVRKYSR